TSQLTSEVSIVMTSPSLTSVPWPLAGSTPELFSGFHFSRLRLEPKSLIFFRWGDWARAEANRVRINNSTSHKKIRVIMFTALARSRIAGQKFGNQDGPSPGNRSCVACRHDLYSSDSSRRRNAD